MPEKNFTKELSALIQLLDEPDEQVYAAIRTRIIAMGVDALPLLEEADDNILAPKETARIEKLMNAIRVEDVYAKLKSWAEDDSHDLLVAWMLISGFHSPEERKESMETQVDKLYRDIDRKSVV